MGRFGWDEYFMAILEAVSLRATCDRGRSASVIVRDNRVLATGYVGASSGRPHCDDDGHLMKTLDHGDGRRSRHCMRTDHSEQNAVANAAWAGVSTAGATIYTRMTPCRGCAGMIVRAGIVRVVAQQRHHTGSEGESVLRAAGVSLEFVSGSECEYDDKEAVP